jgi:hypothetical protein
LSSLVRQGVSFHRSVSGPPPGQFQVLRQGCREIVRCTWVWLSRCRQRVLPDQNTQPRLSIREARLRLGGWGAPLSAPPLESPPSVCGGASHSSVSDHSPAIDGLQRPLIGQPRCGHQPEILPQESCGVSILTTPSTSMPANSSTITYWAHFSPTIGSPMWRSCTSFCVLTTSCALVQEVLLSQGPSLYHFPRYSHLPGLSAKLDNLGRQSLPFRLRLSGPVPGCAEENRTTSVSRSLRVNSAETTQHFQGLGNSQ